MRICVDCGKENKNTKNKRCSNCAKEFTAKKHGMTRTEYNRFVQKNTAERQGLTLQEYAKQKKIRSAERLGITVAEYVRKTHKYRKHLKSKCDNRDGHLGYKCNFPVKFGIIDGRAVLQVDHVDGNPKNNDPSNLKTYCPCCHRVKTYLNNDHITPGRKTRK
jgi:hypothetical protein